MRAPIVLLLATLLGATAARATDVFVVNSNDADISVIDLATHQVIKTIPLLREPHHLVLSPDKRSLVVGDTTGNALFFLDPRTGDVQRRVTVSDPYQLLYSPNAKFLTTAGLARNQIDIYDAHTLALLHRVPARSMPSHIAYSPDSSMVFVSLQGTNRLIAIRTADGSVAWNSKVGSTPAGVLWNRGHIMVGDMGEAHIAVVDPATGRVERTIPTGRGAHTMFFSPDGKLIYATNRVDGSISVIDPIKLVVLRTIRVPGGPDDLEFAPDGKIWAALRFAQSVGVIDPQTGAIERITVGRSPHGIWMNSHLQARAMIVAADDAVFAGLAAGEAPAGLVLAEGGLETDEVMQMLRALAFVVRRQFEPAAWLVVEQGAVVGLCSLKNAPDEFGAVEIGYGVAPAWRARGVATRAVADVLDWARGDARVAAVTAETAVDNRASHVVLERNGFARIGNRDDAEDGALICWECRVVSR